MNPIILDLIICWFALWALFWDKSDWSNLVFKFILTVVAVWGLYMIYNPKTSITAFVITLTAISLFTSYLWKTRGGFNIIIKIAFTAIAGYGIVVIFSNHLIG